MLHHASGVKVFSPNVENEDDFSGNNDYSANESEATNFVEYFVFFAYTLERSANVLNRFEEVDIGSM